MASALSGMETMAGGVVWYADDELGRSIYARVQRADDERWVIRELYMPPTDRPLATDDLRRIPLGQIEARCNAPDHSERLAATDPDRLSLEDVHVRHGKRFARMLSRLTRRDQQVDLRLPEPVGRDYGNNFYRGAAILYQLLVSVGESPGPAIAEANGVPVSTARRWFKEARRRGFLPPGRTGKVG